MKNITLTILENLIANEEYARKVLPFIKEEYFQDRNEKAIFSEIVSFATKYSKLPTKTSLEVELDNRKDLTEQQYKDITSIVSSFTEDVVDIEWLTDTTEKFCKDRAIYNAVVDGISIIEGRDSSRKPDALPSLLTDALAVSFDNRVGHDYLEDASNRFDYYHRVEERIPFDLDYFNKITKGGLPQKTLNIALAGTGVGKSLFMCHMAANCINQGRNVLYITMEMAEERIAERIDANLLDIPIDQLDKLPKTMFTEKVNNLAKKTVGKLIVKEYPTGSAHVGHFRALLKELKLKRSFIPDIIFIDYLNICSSSRMKSMGGAINSYTYIKAIAEELRGLAVEFAVPVVSATQTTRSGYSNSDPGLEDTSESFGLPATADLMFALVSNEELEQSGQIMVKQLKNRYNDPNKNKRFVVGIDRSKMRLYDVEGTDQTLIDDGIPVFDKTPSGDKFKDFKI